MQCMVVRLDSVTHIGWNSVCFSESSGKELYVLTPFSGAG
jgi:hypothetical protein